MIQKFEEFHSINESKIDINLDIKEIYSIAAECNNTISFKDAQKLAKRFYEIDDVKRKANDFQGLTIKEMAAKFGDKEYEAEWLIHALCCLFPDKYTGSWM